MGNVGKFGPRAVDSNALMAQIAAGLACCNLAFENVQIATTN